MEIKSRSVRAARKIDMNEAETRELIDAQLRQAGWEADSNQLNWKSKKTVPQKGRMIAIAEWPAGNKWADYALFNGLDLVAIAEAKKWGQDISTDLRQSKIYAELVEEKHDATLALGYARRFSFVSILGWTIAIIGGFCGFYSFQITNKNLSFDKIV